MQGVLGRALSLSGLRSLVSATASVGGSGGVGSGGGSGVGVGVGSGALHRTCRAPTLQSLTQRFSAAARCRRRRARSPQRQVLTLVHFSAQLEPCLTRENTLHTLHTP